MNLTRTVPHSFHVLVLSFAVVFSPLTLFGRDSFNSWTNPASGNWGDLKWSLGTRPSTNDSVMITNAGWKAVGIHPSTVANFPSSMTVSNLMVSGPPDSLNTLLLNFAGPANPLTVSGQLTVGPHGNLTILSSALSTAFSYSSTFLITNGSVDVSEGSISTGSGEIKMAGSQLNLSNSDTRFAFLTVGRFSPSTVNQINGTNSAAALYLESGYYNLTNGTVLIGYSLVGAGGVGTFRQFDGRVDITTLYLGSGTASANKGNYVLYSGDLSTYGLSLGISGGEASFDQLGGTNRSGSVNLGGSSPVPRSTSYTLSNGLMAAESINVGPLGGFGQWGGFVVVANDLRLSGASGIHSIYERLFSGFGMRGGSCTVGRLFLDQFSSFSQSAGVFTVSGAVNFDGYEDIGGPATFASFSGGVFSCSSLTSFETEMRLYGGTVIVSNSFWFGGNSSYCPCPPPGGFATFNFTNGTLIANNIGISARMILATSSPGHITNSGSFSLSGFLFANDCTEKLGRFISAGGTLNVANGVAKLYFADSSAESWPSGLNVIGWSGSTNGGGADQLKFGTNASGLTPSQLARIKFVNPDGLPLGTYNAKILATGEVVPVYQSTIYSAQFGGKVVVSWSNAIALQTSTNVEGPYLDVIGATSPYTNNLAPAARRFFRLRQ